MKPLSEQVKQIILAHKEEIDDDNFDRVIADAIQCDVLEELLEAFKKAGVIVPDEVVERQQEETKTKPLSEQVKQIILTHAEEIDDNNFDRTIADAIKHGVLEELLDVFEKSGVVVPDEVVKRQLSIFRSKAAEPH